MALSIDQSGEYMKKYYDEIYKYCSGKCRNEDDAADITQDIFMIFFNNRGIIEDTDIKSYLYKIANNKLHEYFRSLKKAKNYVELEDCEYLKYEDTYHLDSEDEEKGKVLTAEEFEQQLDETQKKILNILSPSEKVIFYKLYIEKKTIQLVVQETGYSEGNVRVKSHRIRKKVRDMIYTTKLFIMVFLFKMFYY